ncbi:hypothetical protein HXX76_014161 [Chlamydomonas incerta]|uniref:RickCE-like catalytic domain-containing protein n=1 Tax=Chlamydomonas incerta TaxID=51695 RepID=A0A835SCZ8_CHLIN|nr:hypothetical protein HXX76_014161 [Chlamydomonas incerta]|eukprot:KAG2425003.1 hypothetical protein HXX76_014161 [Chlamydomonas incerta]
MGHLTAVFMAVQLLLLLGCLGLNHWATARHKESHMHMPKAQFPPTGIALVTLAYVAIFTLLVNSIAAVIYTRDGGEQVLETVEDALSRLLAGKPGPRRSPWVRNFPEKRDLLLKNMRQLDWVGHALVDDAQRLLLSLPAQVTYERVYGQLRQLVLARMGADDSSGPGATQRVNALLQMVADVLMTELEPAQALLDPNHQYDDTEVLQAVKASLKHLGLDGQVFVCDSPLALGHPESAALVREQVAAAVTDARQRRARAVAFAVNFGADGQGMHWAALVLHLARVDVYPIGGCAVFNDSLGTPLRDRGAIFAALQAALQEHLPKGREIWDLCQAQQKDSAGCGAFAVENLVKMAGMDPRQVSVGTLRSALQAVPVDASVLRKRHARALRA